MTVWTGVLAEGWTDVLVYECVWRRGYWQALPWGMACVCRGRASSWELGRLGVAHSVRAGRRVGADTRWRT